MSLEAISQKVNDVLQRVNVVLDSAIPELPTAPDPNMLASLIIVVSSQSDTVAKQHDYVLILKHKLGKALKSQQRELKRAIALTSTGITGTSRTDALTLASEQHKDDVAKVNSLESIVEDLTFADTRLKNRQQQLKSLSYSINHLISLGKSGRALSPTDHPFSPNEQPTL